MPTYAEPMDPATDPDLARDRANILAIADRYHARLREARAADRARGSALVRAVGAVLSGEDTAVAATTGFEWRDRA